MSLPEEGGYPSKGLKREELTEDTGPRHGVWVTVSPSFVFGLRTSWEGSWLGGQVTQGLGVMGGWGHWRVLDGLRPLM